MFSNLRFDYKFQKSKGAVVLRARTDEGKDGSLEKKPQKKPQVIVFLKMIQLPLDLVPVLLLYCTMQAAPIRIVAM